MTINTWFLIEHYRPYELCSILFKEIKHVERHLEVENSEEYPVAHKDHNRTVRLFGESGAVHRREVIKNQLKGD